MKSMIVFIVLVVGGGTCIGFLTAPGPWYADLAKPDFNPPNWVFGPVWTALYILIAIAGWRTWTRARESLAMKAWWAQMALNFLWSPVFFTLQRIDAALLIIVLLLAAILLFIAATWSRDRTAAVLFLPYAAWVGFATVLNASLLYLNG